MAGAVMMSARESGVTQLNDSHSRNRRNEARLSGRRTHLRMRVDAPWLGAMRVSRDVWLHQAAGEGLAVFSTTPGVVDEELTLELVSGEETAVLRVKVVDSRPVIVDGAVRHRLKLLTLGASESADGN